MLDIVKTDEEILAFDVSDEALEIAGQSERPRQLYPWGLHWPVCVSGLSG
jgi:hypothetical protein